MVFSFSRMFQSSRNVTATSFFWLSITANAAVTWDGTEGVNAQVFSVSCATSGCHVAGATPPDLSSEAQASVAITDIIARIDLPESDPESMPFFGDQLSSTLRNLVRNWRDGGTPENALPSFSSVAASSVSTTGATVTANVQENGLETSFDVEYGLSATLSGSTSNTGNQTFSGTGGGTTIRAMSRALTGLTCGTRYYYRVRGIRSGAVASRSGISSFTTSRTNATPSITTSVNLPAATEDAAYTTTISASDSDCDDNLSFSLTGTRPGGMTISSAGVISWTPDNDDFLNSPVSVTVRVVDLNDSPQNAATRTFNISVNNTNDRPAITPFTSGQLQATEDVEWTLSPVVTDIDGDTSFSWSLPTNPAGINIDPGTGEMSWTPVNGQSTSGSTTIRVEDGGGLSDTLTFTVSVTAENDAPVLAALTPPNATEDEPWFYDVMATDIDSSDLTFSLSNEPAGMDIDADTGRITWTPTEGVLTSGTVTVTVNDNSGTPTATDSDTFSISVTPVNDRPAFDAPSTSATEGVQYIYTPTRGGSSEIDPDDANDGSGELTWSLTGAPVDMAISVTGVITWTPENNVSSSGELTLRVTDDESLFDEQTFTISVTATNNPPVLTPIADIDVSEDIPFQTQLLVSDIDDQNNGVDLMWSIANAPDYVSLNTTGLLSVSPVEGSVSVTGVEVTVQDGLENGATPQTRSFDINVTAVNDEPVLSPPPTLTATEDQQLTYAFSVSDPDDANDGALVWRIENAPEGMALSNRGVLTWTPVEGQLTSGEVSVFVRDGGEDGSLEQTQSFTVAVTAVNDAPVFGSVTPPGATEDIEFRYTVPVSDADDANDGSGALRFQLLGAPMGMAIDGLGEITWTPTEGVLTSGTFTVAVEDGLEDGVTPQTTEITIAVTAVNDAPQITSMASTSAREANPYRYESQVSDPDDANDGSGALIFSLENAPDGMEVSSMGVVTWLPPEGTGLVGPITLVVADGGEDAAAPARQEFSIDVGVFNSPPSIESTAPTAATEDEEYRYDVTAADVDDENNGTDLSFTLENAPEGMTVSATGEIRWTPLEGVLSAEDVVVTVADGGEDEAAAARESFSITVTPVNDAPQITSVAPAAVIERRLYEYAVQIQDPDDENNGVDLNFALNNEPAGMVVDANGRISWTPPEGTRTSGAVTLTVSDGGEDEAPPATETFAINVMEFNTPPAIVSTPPNGAIEDTEYRYALEIDDIDDPNDGSDALSFVLINAPEGMDIDTFGVITWTPLEGVLSSGDVTIQVADGGEDAAAVAEQLLNVAVTPVNDPPVIVSTPPSDVIEDSEYRYTLEVEDPDDQNNGLDLRYTLIDAPSGMRISRIGVLTWPTDENSPAHVTLEVSVSDGGEDGVAAVIQEISISVNFDEDSDQITNDDDNCRQTANTDQADNDADGFGDVCDDDDDNDTMSDDFEIANGLDPFDPSDANLDSDGDGRTNAEEAQAGSNPFGDDVAPVITAPRDIRIAATGYLTAIELGDAVATDNLDGPVAVTPDSRPTQLRPGRHLVQWQSTDSGGNTAEITQTVDIVPLLGVSSGQTVLEGERAEITFYLNGDAVRYPVSLRYRIEGTAGASDHTLRSGEFELNETLGSLSFTVLNDDETEAEESIVVVVESADNAALVGELRHTVRIVEGNIAPEASLEVTQSGVPGLIVAREGGLVIVDSNATDANGDEGLSYDWSDSDNRLVPTSGLLEERFVFDPVDLQPGFYLVSLTVADEAGVSTDQSILIEIAAAGAADVNGNGVEDSQDRATVPSVLALSDDTFIAADIDTQLVLGASARRSGTDTPDMDISSLVQTGLDGSPVSAFPNGNTPVGAAFDFVVRGLSGVGLSARVVLPLEAPLGEGTQYWKLREEGWGMFVEDERNILMSSAPVQGLCPAPGHAQYRAGLNPGDQCVQLTLEDGGPNDVDGVANGEVRDPGVFATANRPVEESGGEGGSDNGGGSLSPPILFAFIAMAIAIRRRRFWSFGARWRMMDANRMSVRR